MLKSQDNGMVLLAWLCILSGTLTAWLSPMLAYRVTGVGLFIIGLYGLTQYTEVHT